MKEAKEQVSAERLTKSPFTKKELGHFQELLLKKRTEAQEDIDRMRGTLENARENSQGDSAYSFHMADAGTDAMEREKLYMMIARQQKYIGYLNRAMDRIENGVFGICKVTGQAIAKERLDAVPHTEISIEAKLQQQQGGRQ